MQGFFSRMMVMACLVLPCCASASADDSYTFTVRGIIKGLPGTGRSSNEVLVTHEPIPEYRDSSGQVVGMSAMTMPFYLSEGLSVGDLKVGDAVELKVEQHIRPAFSEKVVLVTKK